MTRKEAYHEYLSSPAWQSKRQAALDRGHRCCTVCGAQTELQVHHLTYAHIFEEDMADLMVLCDKHHDAVEALIAQGRISRVGDVNELASRTLSLLRAQVDVKVVAPSRGLSPKQAKKQRREDIRWKILDAPGFEEASRMGKEAFWAWFMDTFKRDRAVLKCHSLAWHLKVEASKLADYHQAAAKLAKNGGAVALTSAVLKTFESPRRGFNRQQLAVLGIPWPPPHGWMKRMRKMFVSGETLQRLQELRTKPK